MRFANIFLFVAAALLGITFSVAAVWNLPFSIFTITDDKFDSVIRLLETGFSPDKFYAVEALRDVVRWGGLINFVFAAICAILAVTPALFTIRLAESNLFGRAAFIGWKMIAWMSILGAIAVALWPVPLIGVIYVTSCAVLICGYIVTYQWPKKHKDPLKMPELRHPEPRPHRRVAGEEV